MYNLLILLTFSTLGDVPEVSPVSPNSSQDRSSVHSPLRSPLKRQSSVHSGRLGSTKSLSAAVFADKPPPALPGGVQFSSEVSRSDENVLDSPRQRRSYGSFPFTPSADSNTFHQYRSADSSMSVADSEAYFSAAEDFEPISSADEGPGTYPGRKKKRRQQMQQPQQPAYHMENYRSVHIYVLQLVQPKQKRSTFWRCKKKASLGTTPSVFSFFSFQRRTI